MNMENTPLNKAHQLERRAEALLKQKKFDECIECHKQALDLFTECFKLTKNPAALESIRLQKETNERQIKTLYLKKAYFERIEKEKRTQNDTCNNIQKLENLEKRIFRTIDTHDSLICYLGHRGNDNFDGTCCQNEKTEKEGSPPITGNKHPKDDSTVIEELKVLSAQLRESVHGLLIELDDKNKEIDKLKETVRILESEKESKTSTNLKVITDSSGGTSPYVFSPCSELSPDIQELRSLPTLPPLEPLQMPPSFDFTNLKINK